MDGSERTIMKSSELPSVGPMACLKNWMRGVTFCADLGRPGTVGSKAYTCPTTATQSPPGARSAMTQEERADNADTATRCLTTQHRMVKRAWFQGLQSLSPPSRSTLSLAGPTEQGMLDAPGTPSCW